MMIGAHNCHVYATHLYLNFGRFAGDAIVCSNFFSCLFKFLFLCLLSVFCFSMSYFVTEKRITLISDLNKFFNCVFLPIFPKFKTQFYSKLRLRPCCNYPRSSFSYVCTCFVKDGCS